jgi:hypothetical protein
MKKPKFKPYANEAEVVEIGGLTLENRLDRISVSGDVDLTLDQTGLAQARLLHGLLGEIVAKLEARELPASLPPPDVTKVGNPFD